MSYLGQKGICKKCGKKEGLFIGIGVELKETGRPERFNLELSSPRRVRFCRTCLESLSDKVHEWWKETPGKLSKPTRGSLKN